MIGAPWSVDLQPERLYHRRPESNIVLETTPEFLGRRVGTGFEARIDQLLLVGRFRERRAYRLRNLLDDRLRRSRRSDRPDGRLIGQAGEAALRHRRKLGRGDETLGASTTLADFSQARDSQITFSVTHGGRLFGGADHG